MNPTESSPACTKCGVNAGSSAHFDLCETCNKARIAEIYRISEHHEKHPDECCCDTFFGRACCKSPIHGGWWQVNGIQHGDRFCFFIRAKNRKEAMEVGTEACQDNGEECIGVKKATAEEAAAA